ncbi:MAG: flagellar protein FliS [Lachnospira sp.]|nr:flagellar protein FliS [Lachnospira sp.]
MVEDNIKVFTNRIAGANRSELIVIIYDIALDYMNEAKTELENNEIEAYRLSIKRAKRCINYLSSVLNMEYAISMELLRVYVLMNNMCVRASIKVEGELVDALVRMLTNMKRAFVAIAKEDDSKPIMTEARVVQAGFTYSKNSINEIGTSIHMWQS